MEANTEKLIRDLADNFGTAVEQMAAKLGTTAAHLWEVLVRQAVIDGAVNIIFFLLLTALLSWTAKLLIKRLKSEKSMGDHENFGMAVWFIGLVIWVILLFMSPRAIGGIFNPEYAALKEVAEALKK